jgi:SPX domain protein involved in polyphosphate accumulation
MSYLRLNYIGKSSLRLVIKENEKKEPDYITKYQYQSKIRQKPSSIREGKNSLCRAPTPTAFPERYGCSLAHTKYNNI